MMTFLQGRLSRCHIGSISFVNTLTERDKEM